MADIAASVLAKLKNKAKASGISYQQCLQLFFQEEFLRRLAGSKYADNFILKGGLFIYTLTNFESRATVDVDFLMRGLNNDLARMDEIIAEILAVDTGNDFVTFKAGKTEPIALQRKYHGISTQIYTTPYRCLLYLLIWPFSFLIINDRISSISFII